MKAGYQTSPKQQNEIECGKHTISLGGRTLIIGILNTTPDSFSDGGKFNSVTDAVNRCYYLAEQGCDIIDIGGESTRPGSAPVSAAEEIARTVPVINEAANQLQIPISIDTRKAVVAKAALDAGASIINDISALHDPDMASVAAEHCAPVVLMHMQGTPETMQKKPQYENVIDEIKSYLHERIDYAVRNGINEEKIIIDPGIGFGKTLEHNLDIFRRLDELLELGRPLLVGPSRKSFIGMITGADVNNRFFGTAAAVAASILKGAQLIRAHDVKEMREVADITDAIIRGKPDKLKHG